MKWMMKESGAQIRRVFEFLSDHYQSQQNFSKDEFQQTVQWDPMTFEIIFEQSLNPLLISNEDGLLQVSEIF